MNCYKHNLSATHLLSTAQSVVFLIGINFVRFASVEIITSQIKYFISTLRQQYPHLSDTNNLTIIHFSPCLKPLLPLFTHASLINNIHQYNHQLLNLSFSLNFRIINSNVTDSYIDPNRIHINYIYKNLA